jgi:hypothetical protein
MSENQLKNWRFLSSSLETHLVFLDDCLACHSAIFLFLRRMTKTMRRLPATATAKTAMKYMGNPEEVLGSGGSVAYVKVTVMVFGMSFSKLKV